MGYYYNFRKPPVISNPNSKHLSIKVKGQTLTCIRVNSKGCDPCRVIRRRFKVIGHLLSPVSIRCDDSQYNLVNILIFCDVHVETISIQEYRSIVVVVLNTYRQCTCKVKPVPVNSVKFARKLKYQLVYHQNEDILIFCYVDAFRNIGEISL